MYTYDTYNVQIHNSYFVSLTWGTNPNICEYVAKYLHVGLASVLSIHCARCQQNFRFSTSAKVKCMSGG